MLLSTDPVRQLVAQIADLNVIHAVQISGASVPDGTKSGFGACTPPDQP